MRITVQLQLRQYDFPLKMLPMFLDAYWWGIKFRTQLRLRITFSLTLRIP